MRKLFRKTAWLFSPLLIGFFLISSLTIILFLTTPIPNFDSIKKVKISDTVKFYDREDESLLFDISPDRQLQQVDFEDVSPHVFNALIAIEDKDFYNHNGIKITSILRSVITNLSSFSFSSGGSTITQQLVKNSLLNPSKTINRKLREVILSLKIESELSKKEILESYINIISYGHTVYGVGEAAQFMFQKKPSELTAAEAAYLAALIRAPSFYSPFGNNKGKLEKRKNLVLLKMLEQNLLTREEYEKATNEEVFFSTSINKKIKAPHFVFFVQENLEEKYGKDFNSLSEKRFVTSLDLNLQTKTEEIVRRNIEDVEARLGASNVSVVVLKVDTGEILAMVGSRDYFDKEIDGKVNVATSPRQPGSSFKPIVYAAGFEKGYTPDTVLFDVPTQFESSCDKEILETTAECYSTVNYDGEFRGPITNREALAQSRNVNAVKMLYLAGIRESIRLARKMGIDTLEEKDASNYGLSLVLGTGSARLLDMVNAYAVFARDGKYTPYQYLKNENEPSYSQVIKEQTARYINSTLSDKDARFAVFRSSLFSVPGHDVAVKTGTAGSLSFAKDLWMIGYSPSVVVGVWAGNNDEKPLKENSFGASLARIWNDVMTEALREHGDSKKFIDPIPVLSKNPVLDGNFLDKKKDPHSILHFVNEDNPNKEGPSEGDQYERWEYGVEEWLKENKISSKVKEKINDDITFEKRISIAFPQQDSTIRATRLRVVLKTNLENKNFEFYLNGSFIGISSLPLFTIEEEKLKRGKNTLQVVARDGSTSFSDFVSFNVR